MNISSVLYLFFMAVIVTLTISYAYFWIVVAFARLHKHIDKSEVTNGELIKAIRRAKRRHDPNKFIIQITTKGGSLPVVTRGIDSVIEAAIDYRALRGIVSVEVITEDRADVREIKRLYGKTPIKVKPYLLPKTYQTKGGTQLKARALHYMVEKHRKNPSNSYIVHYDEESVFTPDNLARLARTLLNKPIGISEGTISYALDWQDANLICRTLESNRPFGCHECYLMMTHPAPLHLHGSNLVIQERIENEIGWDIGQYRNNPLIAEDLVFGLMAYLKFGKDVFGWHGVEMIEQPPFTLKAAYKQRERWVMGALQGVAHVRDLPDWKNIKWTERWKIQLVIRLRVWTYALGAPISLISIATWSTVGLSGLVMAALGSPFHMQIALWAVPGMIMWLAANQIGLWQNLSYTSKTGLEKFVEHCKVLAATPIAGLFDTAGPFVAVAKWTIGVRGIVWIPTPKLSSASNENSQPQGMPVGAGAGQEAGAAA